MTWVSIVLGHWNSGKGAGKSSALLGSVFNRLGGRRGASRRQAVVTWVSIVFGHGNSRELALLVLLL